MKKVWGYLISSGPIVAFAIIGIMVLCFFIIFNFLGILSGKSNVMPDIILDFRDNIPFLSIALIAGAVGSYVRILLFRTEHFYNNLTLKHNKITDDSDLYIKKSMYKDRDVIILGAWLGVIGYFILESKIFIRVFYNKIDVENIEIQFVPVTLICMVFGYFAIEIIKIAQNKINDLQLKPTE